MRKKEKEKKFEKKRGRKKEQEKNSMKGEIHFKEATVDANFTFNQNEMTSMC